MVAKFLDIYNLSWKRRAFALSKDGRIVFNTVFFLSAVKHRKVIHFKASVFPPYLQFHGLFRSRNFATVATWRNDFSSLLLGSLYKRVFERLTSTGSLFAIILNYLDATKFVFLSVFTITETICSKIEENRRPKMPKKRPPTVDVRRSILVEQKIQGT